MKAIILCAGYGTRLGELTKNMPKALLEIQGKSMLNLLLENIEEIDDIDEIVIVSNTKFFDNFIDYRPCMTTSKKVTILNDGTISNDTRLGAIADIKFALDALKYKGEIMVLAGDNWFDFKLKDFYNFYLANGKRDAIFGQTKTDLNELRSGAVATLAKNNRVTNMEEKPQNPKGNFSVGPFYIYNTQSVKLIDTYLASGGNPDAPGHFPTWLTKNHAPVYAYDIAPHSFIDIGTPEMYHRMNAETTSSLR